MQLEQDYFRLLGVAPQFDLDSSVLKQNARKLQREYHPDRYASHTPQEQRLAAQVSAQINSALATLLDPVRRANYLLQRQGIEINAQTHTERDTDFLMQQMALRETLEEARMNADVDALDALAEQVQGAYAAAQEDFNGSARAHNVAAEPVDEKTAAQMDDQVKAGLISQISKMRFYQKLLEELQAASAVMGA
ncbi:MAG: Fe-S protein assembly co-chaperone HscB [Gammaproteobacteria bacterium]|nr:Fe-S protein assembly co-chaperone HscB [Gammaproteobacteria bacterium]